MMARLARGGWRLLASMLAALATPALAATSPFDLAGPTLKVVVARGSNYLPIAEVPNLAAGDRLWIKADLPASQSAHYLLIAAFLAGSTNPPPEGWFHPCKTWTGPCAREGLTVTVPEGAQQVLVFLAPESSGDFDTVVSAVRGRPGAFVRASQDLNQAALDRSRLDLYLQHVQHLSFENPARLKEAAPLLARSLAIKVDEKCLDRIPALQASCLLQGQEALILNDGHSTSIVQALTSGPASDLLFEVSATPQAGYGYYSPYIASVVDLARIFDSFRSAQYHYIPAMAALKGDALALKLNTAPSFHDPKSVLVVGLPAVEQPQLPPLHAVDPNALHCASRSTLLLPVEGAPLVFSTGYAHDLTLTLTTADGKAIALPARPDAVQGGYVVDTTRLKNATLGDTVQGALRGFWGFTPYEGPRFTLSNARAQRWTLADPDGDGPVVGRQDTVHLKAENTSCVDGILLRDPTGKELQADWKPIRSNEVEVKLPLQGAAPGAMTLLVRQAGASEPQTIPFTAFPAASRIEGFTLHAGDTTGVLKGSQLDEVASATVGPLLFLPAPEAGNEGEPLTLQAQDPAQASLLKAGRPLTGKVTLRDGRSLPLKVTVAPARPRVTLIGKSTIATSPDHEGWVLASPEELPSDAHLRFSLRATNMAALPADLAIEVAPLGGTPVATLNAGSGTLRLVDAQVALAELDPAQALGPSAFGPLRFRPVAGGVAGEWQPLVTLVRRPRLGPVRCPADETLACTLSGRDLDLIAAVASTLGFETPAPVPEGFTASRLLVPRPQQGKLYLRLRDDPAVVQTVALLVETLPPAP